MHVVEEHVGGQLQPPSQRLSAARELHLHPVCDWNGTTFDMPACYEQCHASVQTRCKLFHI